MKHINKEKPAERKNVSQVLFYNITYSKAPAEASLMSEVPDQLPSVC